MRFAFSKIRITPDCIQPYQSIKCYLQIASEEINHDSEHKRSICRCCISATATTGNIGCAAYRQASGFITGRIRLSRPFDIRSHANAKLFGLRLESIEEHSEGF